MTNISGIQLSSKMVLNTAEPLDGKQRLSTNDRLSLSTTQRWIGMLVYDVDLNVWKTLINEPGTDSTEESDWQDFLSLSSTGFNIANESFDLNVNTTDYDLSNTPINGSISLYINGLTNEEGEHYTIDGTTISLTTPVTYLTGHKMSVKYFY